MLNPFIKSLIYIPLIAALQLAFVVAIAALWLWLYSPHASNANFPILFEGFIAGVLGAYIVSTISMAHLAYQKSRLEIKLAAALTANTHTTTT